MIYRGHRETNDRGGTTSIEVTVGGAGVVYAPLPPRNDIYDHSPNGFEWGYGGSGPAQLALAICVHALGEAVGREGAVYQRFKDEFVATWGDDWDLPWADVVRWHKRIERAVAGRKVIRCPKCDGDLGSGAIPPGVATTSRRFWCGHCGHEWSPGGTGRCERCNMTLAAGEDRQCSGCSGAAGVVRTLATGWDAKRDKPDAYAPVPDSPVNPELPVAPELSEGREHTAVSPTAPGDVYLMLPGHRHNSGRQETAIVVAFAREGYAPGGESWWAAFEFLLGGKKPRQMRRSFTDEELSSMLRVGNVADLAEPERPGSAILPGGGSGPGKVR